MQTSVMGDWEYYRIVILSQPTEVRDLEYNFQWQEVISESLTTISTTVLKNKLKTRSEIEYDFKERKQISFDFIQFYGPKIGHTKLFAQIPEGIYRYTHKI